LALSSVAKHVRVVAMRHVVARCSVFHTITSQICVSDCFLNGSLYDNRHLVNLYTLLFRFLCRFTSIDGKSDPTLIDEGAALRHVLEWDDLQTLLRWVLGLHLHGWPVFDERFPQNAYLVITDDALTPDKGQEHANNDHRSYDFELCRAQAPRFQM
jgi:hypothetical protein